MVFYKPDTYSSLSSVGFPTSLYLIFQNRANNDFDIDVTNFGHYFYDNDKLHPFLNLVSLLQRDGLLSSDLVVSGSYYFMPSGMYFSIKEHMKCALRKKSSRLARNRRAHALNGNISSVLLALDDLFKEYLLLALILFLFPLSFIISFFWTSVVSSWQVIKYSDSTFINSFSSIYVSFTEDVILRFALRLFSRHRYLLLMEVFQASVFVSLTPCGAFDVAYQNKGNFQVYYRMVFLASLACDLDLNVRYSFVICESLKHLLLHLRMGGSVCDQNSPIFGHCPQCGRVVLSYDDNSCVCSFSFEVLATFL